MNNSMPDDLVKEFEESGLDLDSFMKKKLAEAGKDNASEIVDEINSAATMIEQNYADLKAHKAADGNRQSWLQRKLGAIFSKISVSQAGQVIGHLTENLKGSSEEVPEDAVYNEINAETKIEELDKAIKESVRRDLLNNGGNNE